MTRIGFIGLGAMGYPMAGHLVAAGHDVAVFNRTTAVAERFCEEHPGARLANSPADACADAEVGVLIVGNDDSVRSVALGDDGALAGLNAGAVLIDHTTASATVAIKVGEAAALSGVGFIDAPVSGGESGAQNGVLTIMCGGDQSTFDRVEPIMTAYSGTRTLIGPIGSGQTTKMVNQIAIAGTIQGLAEALNLGISAGLDMDKVLATISNGAAGSWQMSNRGSTMVADSFDFGFAIEWMIKDLGIALAEAHRLGAPTPVASIVAGYYDELMESGDGRSDTSALIRRFR
ncbi:MAG: NAD(P)-dependent oxidoreductase [Acidimicrobiia bacterium]|nr:NAD(P)-dependent oxidoreductase [Acidimicrobiia bacterium]